MRGFAAFATFCIAGSLFLGTTRCGEARGQPATSSTRGGESPKSRLPSGLTSPPSGDPLQVAPVDRSRRQAAKDAAAKIDEILAAQHESAGVSGGDRLDDPRFLRRAYLEIGGRIPTCDEALRFLVLDAKNPERRSELIDSLLESPDYVSRFYCLWADTLRLVDGRQSANAPYLDWIKRAIAENRPYDDWVTDLLTAKGKITSNPAVGYQLRDEGMPFEAVDMAMRVFLGTQIGCAQCHDHPSAPWTRQQFYELAAFTYGDVTGLHPLRNAKGQKVTRRDPEAEAHGRLWRVPAEEWGNGAIRELLLSANAKVVDYRPAPLSMPPSKPSPGGAGPVRPKVLWGALPDGPVEEDGRKVFARWITSHENRQFARTIANRIWKVAMGRGIVEPVDDFSESNPPSNPELLDHLADEMVRLDFDIREFLRILTYTDVWQNVAVSYDPMKGKAFPFHAPVLRRMSAEQVWDSVLTLVAHDPYAYHRPHFEEIIAANEIDLSSGAAIEFASIKGAVQRWSQGPFVATDKPRDLASGRFYFGWYDFVRASELPSPLPLFHPLREFGQGNRTSPDIASEDAAMTQVFSLMNGQIVWPVFEAGSYLHATVTRRPVKEWADVVFYSTVTRPPTKEERAIAEAAIAAEVDRWKGLCDVISALLNTREFLFVQ